MRVVDHRFEGGRLLYCVEREGEREWVAESKVEEGVSEYWAYVNARLPANVAETLSGRKGARVVAVREAGDTKCYVTEVQWKRAQETHMFTSEVMKEYGMDALLDYWEQRTRQ